MYPKDHFEASNAGYRCAKGALEDSTPKSLGLCLVFLIEETDEW
jgi:hypothetical protein